MAYNRLRKVSSWMDESERNRGFEEELLECRLIVLKIVRYMKENHLSQKELAERLEVSPQYINKFLHGQDLDMKVSTVLRYGRLLGLNLLEIPKDENTISRYDLVIPMSKVNFSPFSQFSYYGAFCLSSLSSSINASAQKGTIRSGRYDA